jgi:hypothetical protein
VCKQYYYRLKKIDIDGRFGFSSIISLTNLRNKNDMLVIPNPVVSKATVLFKTTMFGEEFILMNSNGQLIEKLMVNGNNATINLTGRPAGLYFLVSNKLSLSGKINKKRE